MSRVSRRLYPRLFIIGLILSGYSISGFIPWVEVRQSWDGNIWTAQIYAFRQGSIVHKYTVDNSTRVSTGGVVFSLVDPRWSTQINSLITPVLSLYAIPISLIFGLAIMFLPEKLTKTLRTIFLILLATFPIYVFNELAGFNKMAVTVWAVTHATASYGAGAIISIASSIMYFAQVCVDYLGLARPRGGKEFENAAQKTSKT